MFNWFSFLTYALLATYSPGPNNIMSMSFAGEAGFKKSWRFNMGVLIGRTITMLLCALFSGLLYVYIPVLQLPMKTAGFCYMMYLAWKCLHISIDSGRANGKELKATVLTGVLVQFINAKAFISGINVMSSYVLPAYRAPAMVAGFAVLFAFIGFSATVCWGLFGSLLCGLFVRRRKALNIAMAALLAYCAVSLFL
jgi:cysteine/O-acetylserine efflux protein